MSVFRDRRHIEIGVRSSSPAERMVGAVSLVGGFDMRRLLLTVFSLAMVSASARASIIDNQAPVGDNSGITPFGDSGQAYFAQSFRTIVAYTKVFD